MLVSSNNILPLRKAFEELSISTQENCGFSDEDEEIDIPEFTEDEMIYILRSRIIPSDASDGNTLEEQMIGARKALGQNIEIIPDLDDDALLLPEESDSFDWESTSIPTPNENVRNLFLSKYFPDIYEDFFVSEPSDTDVTNGTLSSDDNLSTISNNSDISFPEDSSKLELCDEYK